MVAPLSFTSLVRRRWWIYGGGVALILGIRTLVAPSTPRRLAASILLGMMVLTYAGELWVGANRRLDRPLMLLPSVAGIVGGIWLALDGSLPGLLFTGGGLLFLNQSMTAREGESP